MSQPWQRSGQGPPRPRPPSISPRRHRGNHVEEAYAQRCNSGAGLRVLRDRRDASSIGGEAGRSWSANYAMLPNFRYETSPATLKSLVFRVSSTPRESRLKEGLAHGAALASRSRGQACQLPFETFEPEAEHLGTGALAWFAALMVRRDGARRVLQTIISTPCAQSSECIDFRPSSDENSQVYREVLTPCSPMARLSAILCQVSIPPLPSPPPGV